MIPLIVMCVCSSMNSQYQKRTNQLVFDNTAERTKPERKEKRMKRLKILKGQ